MNEEEDTVQVFVPSSNLKDSVTCLDPFRLGNQIWREAKTIITGGWPYHPASKMWRNYKAALAKYCLYGLVELYVERSTISKETFNRHYQFFAVYLSNKHLYTLKSCNPNNPLTAYVPMPGWWGTPSIHASHRRALLYKDYGWYSQFNWEEAPAIPNSDGSLPYIWPDL